jgi:hypothetical protein
MSTNGAERMRITSGGIIQTGTGASSIYISAASGAPYINLDGGAGSSTAALAANYRFGNAISGVFWLMQLDASNQFGTWYYNSGWTKVGYQTTGGTWTNSDERRKENIKLSDYGLNEVLQLIPKKFNFKNDERKIINLGFIAQDVLPIIPEAVQTDIDDNKEYYAMNYSNLIPVLVKAIQEMNTKLDEQNQTIQNLQEQINILAK